VITTPPTTPTTPRSSTNPRNSHELRFRNEALAIKSRGGITVCIGRPGVGPANDHPSEHDPNGWHFDDVVVNDGTVADLKSKADDLLLKFG
jgi:hypothetical protein